MQPRGRAEGVKQAKTKKFSIIIPIFPLSLTVHCVQSWNADLATLFKIIVALGLGMVGGGGICADKHAF